MTHFIEQIYKDYLSLQKKVEENEKAILNTPSYVRYSILLKFFTNHKNLIEKIESNSFTQQDEKNVILYFSILQKSNQKVIDSQIYKILKQDSYNEGCKDLNSYLHSLLTNGYWGEEFQKKFTKS